MILDQRQRGKAMTAAKALEIYMEAFLIRGMNV
jgi:hypothetical protein